MPFMQTGGESTTVNANAMTTGITSLETAASKLRAELDRLTEVLDSQLKSWTGEAKDTYYRCQDNWNKDCESMAATISVMKSTLNDINEGYGRTEQAIVQDFS